MRQKIHESPFQMLKALLRGTRFIPGMSIEQYINRFWVTNVRVAVQTLQRRQENAGWKSPENGAEKILKMGKGKSWKWGWKILKMGRRNPENGMEKSCSSHLEDGVHLGRFHHFIGLSLAGVWREEEERIQDGGHGEKEIERDTWYYNNCFYDWLIDLLFF